MNDTIQPHAEERKSVKQLRRMDARRRQGETDRAIVALETPMGWRSV